METKMNRMMTLATMVLLAGFFINSTATEVPTSPSSIQPTAEPKPAVSDMATSKLPTAHVSETTVTNSSQITPTTVSVNSTMATSPKPFSSTVTSPTKPKTTSKPNQTGEISAATTLYIKSTAETSLATDASPPPSTIPASSMGTTAVSSTQTLAFGSAASATTAEPPRTSLVTTAEPLRTSPATETKTETTDTINRITPNISPNKQHRSNALSSASVIAIMCGVIALVILVFGGAYYFKMRNASYGRLRDDGEYGSVGNFHNPLYEH